MRHVLAVAEAEDAQLARAVQHARYQVLWLKRIEVIVPLVDLLQ